MRAFIAEGQRVFNRLAALKIPTVAAIHGACAGGGYEITLACDYRVASDAPATRIGLPETTLGLVPAWGGATRLPRLIGPEKAAEVILKGKLYAAQEALKLGLVDEVGRRRTSCSMPRGRNCSPAEAISPEGRASARPALIEAPRSQKSRAPARAAEIINRSLTSSIEESLARELDAIVELGETESTRNLIRNFFLADKYRKGATQSAGRKVRARRGYRRRRDGFGNRAMAQLARHFGDPARRERRAARSRPGQHREDLRRSGEARPDERGESEGRPLPHRRFSQSRADARGADRDRGGFGETRNQEEQFFTISIPKSTTPTSSRPTPPRFRSATLAAQTKHPERVIGLHFFNPVSRMKLIEVVIGEQTSDETKERALAFARQIGKMPVVVRDSPGFLVNRVLFPYLLDAAELFEQGVDAKKIDDGAGGVGDADGAVASDRRDRGRHHGRYRGHAREIVRRARPHTGDSDRRCGKQECSAAKPAAAFTNTKAKSSA